MKQQYAQYVLDTLKPHGSIVAKPLFGGFGFYRDGVIFALIIDEQLYFKIDDATRPDFEAHDSIQFVYEGKSKTVGMPYMTLPEAILENRDELPLWIEKACQVSLRSKKIVKKRPAKKTDF